MYSQEEDQIKQFQIGSQFKDIVEKRLSQEKGVSDPLEKDNKQIIQNTTQNIQRKFGELLFENKIKIVKDKKEYANDLKIEVLQVSKDWRMFKLSIKYQQYCFDNIDMVINDFVSPLHCLKHEKKGNHGSVYPIKVNQKNVAIKCIILQNQSDFQEDFQSILKEFLFTKLASTIKAGPKVLVEQLGFSMFIYHNCIEFAMELCDQINYYTNQAQIDLRECLETLHDFKLIHYDVKLSNICYSPIYGKNILIDYGISEIAKTERHQKQLVSFRGTLDYCSDQMKKVVLSKNKKQLVNLYENDKHGLNQTIQQLKKMIPQKVMESQLIFQLSSYYQYYLVISHLFNNHRKIQLRTFFKQFLKDKQKIKQYLEEILKTINSLRYSSNIQKIFSKQKQFSQVLHLIKETNLRLAKRQAKIICKESLGEDNTEIQYKFRIILGKFLPTKSQINQPIDRLKSQDLVKQLNVQTYLFQVAKYIKVESKKCTYQEKLRISAIFLKLHIKSGIEGQHQITEAIFHFFYQFCINGQITDLKINIMQELIASFLLFELISETQYLQFFSKVLTSCRTIDKLFQLKLFLIRFLCAVEWVRYKVTISKYDYWRLKLQLQTLFYDFVSKLQFTHPLKDILQLIKIIKKTNNLNQIIVDVNTYQYFGRRNYHYRPINLSNLNIGLLLKKYPSQINVQHFSVEEVIGYGLQFDIQIIEDYYEKKCLQIHQNLSQFQVQAKQLILFLICQNNTQPIDQGQSFKKLNQFLLQSKQKKVPKYYFIQLGLIAMKNRQVDYYKFIYKFNLQSFNQYTFYDTLYKVFQIKLDSLLNNKQYTDQQFDKNIQAAASKYLSKNNLLDWYKFQQFKILVDLCVTDRKDRFSKQLKYKFATIYLENWTHFQEFISKKLLTTTKQDKQFFQFQYEISSNIENLFMISVAIGISYPQKLQHLTSFINFFDRLSTDLALPIKFQLLLHLINFRQLYLKKQKNYKILFDQLINLGIFLLKMNKQIMIARIIIFRLSSQYSHSYVNRLLLYCTRNNKKLVIQLFYGFYNGEQNYKFTQLFITLYKDHQLQQMLQIIKIVVQYVNYQSEWQPLSRIIAQFCYINFIINQSDERKLYLNAVISLLACKNPFMSFYLITLSMFMFDKRQKERKIYIFICKSLDRLNRQSKNVLERLFLCIFYLNEIKAIQKIINNKRHMRKLSYMILKSYKGYIQMATIGIQECFKEALKLIVKPKIKYQYFYNIFFQKLEKYFKNTQHSSKMKLFNLKRKKYRQKCKQ